MPQKRLKIAHIVSEVEPFSKSGGLASVGSSLPKAHSELGHNVCVITPFYEGIIDKKYYNLEKLYTEEIEIEGKKYKTDFFKGYINSDTPVFFIANKQFFPKSTQLYGSKRENARFFFFNLAVLFFLKKNNFKPDIIHCHDWHTGLIPYLLKNKFKRDKFWKDSAILFTIHNLTYQFGHDWWTIQHNRRDNGRVGLPAFREISKVEKINFAKRAILTADAINTVSETYREEILTKDFGEDLHRILKNREKRVFGVVNGIDYEEYNPLTDPGLFKNYDYKNPEEKTQNKIWLQKHLKLKIDQNVPIFCMTSRIVEQKGFNLLLPILSNLLKLEIQVAIMGDGDKTISEELKKIEKKHSKKFSFIPFDGKYETSFYAGSDFFLLPSRFEPCGINQMIALRYGCIPIVHSIGGLADTILNFNPEKKTGNGFTFKEHSPVAFAMAIARALETYKQKKLWQILIISGLQTANSWKIPAQKYIDLYKTIIRFKHKI